MMPNPEFPEAQIPQTSFRGFDLTQPRRCHPESVRKTAGQTRRRWLVPGRQLQRSRSFPDVVLGKAGFHQWRPHAPLLRSLETRPIVERVIRIRSIDYPFETACSRDRRQHIPKFRLAEIAAV